MLDSKGTTQLYGLITAQTRRVNSPSRHTHTSNAHCSMLPWAGSYDLGEAAGLALVPRQRRHVDGTARDSLPHPHLGDHLPSRWLVGRPCHVRTRAGA